MKNIFRIFVAVTTIVSTVAGQDCSPEELMQCARPLRVLTENSEFGFVVNKEELDRQCPDLNEGIRCIDSYTRRCFNARKRLHFNKLYAGTTKVIQELCQEGAYQEEFLKHAPCMRQVRSDHEDCAHNYQQRIEELNALTTQAQGEEAQPEHVLAEKQVQTVCCSFQAYLRCSEKVVQRACGEETAKFTESFLDRMSSSLIQNHCDQYPTGSEKCAEYFSSAQLNLPSWTLHLCVGIFLFLYNRT